MSAEVVFKDEEVRKFLRDLSNRFRNTKTGQDRRYMGLLSTIVYSDVMEHFQNEEGPDGKWKKWSKSYTEHMQKIGRAGNRILRFSGKLRQNFKPTKVKATGGGFLWYNDAKTESGFEYAGAHQEGGDKLPARPFMWLSDKGMEKIETQTLQFLLEGR